MINSTLYNLKSIDWSTKTLSVTDGNCNDCNKGDCIKLNYTYRITAESVSIPGDVNSDSITLFIEVQFLKVYNPSTSNYDYQSTVAFISYPEQIYIRRIIELNPNDVSIQYDSVFNTYVLNFNNFNFIDAYGFFPSGITINQSFKLNNAYSNIVDTSYDEFDNQFDLQWSNTSDNSDLNYDVLNSFIITPVVCNDGFCIKVYQDENNIPFPDTVTTLYSIGYINGKRVFRSNLINDKYLYLYYHIATGWHSIYEDTLLDTVEDNLIGAGRYVTDPVRDLEIPYGYHDYDDTSITIFNCECGCPDGFTYVNGECTKLIISEPLLDTCRHPYYLNVDTGLCEHVFTTGIYSDQCCFELTDCKTGDVYQTTNDLTQYINKIITVSEFPNRCFSVTKSINCTSPINITFVQEYVDCDACNDIFGYRLENCENPNIFIYTKTDLSQYIDKTVTIENYDDICFYVSTLDIVPPTNNIVDVIVQVGFTDCQSCKLKRYKLVNCDDNLDFIITDTDLELYVGKIIKIKGCSDKCFIVQTSNDTTSTLDVLLDVVYNTCLECNPPIQEVPRKVTSRFVEPNYNINYCSTDEFERVSCSFSDNVYKDMIEDKYGIKHCCKDDYHKSYLKYQLMMYQIKTIPNIACTEVSDNNCNCS